jgi:hypothetical protein
MKWMEYFFALLLIFGLGHPSREPVDPAKSAPLRSRILCDGQTAPEDNVSVQAVFPSGDWAREFVVSRFQKDTCAVDLKIKCLHQEKAGWHDVWSAASAQPSAGGMLALGSCYAWGSSEPAQYIVSGWYKEGTPGSKLEWRQAAIKQVSSHPEVYEFTDPKGGTARLEIGRR